MSSPIAATNSSDAPHAAASLVTDESPPPGPDTAASVDTHEVAIPPVLRALKVSVAVVGAAFLLMYVVVAVLRIRSPFELEWIEGGVVDDVRHILAGHQLYVRPSIKFMPYIYTPLYYYVAAGAAKVFGIGFFPLRLVSFVASLGAFGAVGLLVARETRDRWAGLVSACLLAACFRLGGAWFDLARVDSLFLFLLLAGLALARFARSPKTVALAGVVVSLAFLTKQAALLPAVAVLPFLWRRNPRHAAIYAAVITAGIAGGSLVLNAVSSGWYSMYVFDLPSGHEVVHAEYVDFWTVDMAHFVIAAVIAVAGLAVAAQRRTFDRPSPLWFYLPVTVGLFGSAYISRLHSGGYDNVLQPAHAAVAIGFGLGLHALVRVDPPRPGRPTLPSVAPLGAGHRVRGRALAVRAPDVQPGEADTRLSERRPYPPPRGGAARPARDGLHARSRLVSEPGR